jgi:hypothetical protein
MQRKYNTISDLPICENCGVGCVIDEGNLLDYSDEILERVIVEIDETIKTLTSSVMSYTSTDEYAEKKWLSHLEGEVSSYRKIREMVQAEMDSRRSE